MKHELRIFLEGVQYGYRQANSNRGLMQALDEAEKFFAKSAQGGTPASPVASAESPVSLRKEG